MSDNDERIKWYFFGLTAICITIVAIVALVTGHRLEDLGVLGGATAILGLLMLLSI